MWKVTMLLSHLDKLPPGAQDYWKANFGPQPEPEKKEDEKKEGDKHHH